MVHRRRALRRHRPGPRVTRQVNAVRFPPVLGRRGTATPTGRTARSERLGLTCTREGQVVQIRPGDTVWCPPGEWHWHGATPDRSMTHLAIWNGLAERQDGPETDWGDHVTDEEQGTLRLPCPRGDALPTHTALSCRSTGPVSRPRTRSGYPTDAAATCPRSGTGGSWTPFAARSARPGPRPRSGVRRPHPGRRARPCCGDERRGS